MVKRLVSYRDLLKSSKKNFLEAKNNREFREVFVNTVWQIFEKIVRLCLALISGILIARYLQPERYGVYNYAIAFTSFFATVSNLGSNQILVKDLVQEPEHHQEIVSTAIALRLFSGIFLSALASGLSFIFIEDKTVQILVIIFSFQIIFRASEAIEFFFHSRMDFRWIAYSRSLAAGIATFLLVLAIIKDQSIFVLAVASSVEFLASLLFLSVIYTKQNQFFSLAHISFGRLKRTLRDSWPLIFSGIAITVYMRVDQLMISSMSGNAELGLYSAVVRLTEAFCLIPLAFIQSTFPKLIRLKEEGEQEFYSALQNLYNKVSLMGYASVLFVFLFSKELLGILYGDTYVKAAPIFSLLIWSVVFMTLGTARGSFMVTMNLTGLYLKTVAIASIINIALNYMLIPAYGAFGAAAATVVSYWFAVHGACFLFRPLRKTGNMLTKSLILVR